MFVMLGLHIAVVLVLNSKRERFRSVWRTLQYFCCDVAIYFHILMATCGMHNGIHSPIRILLHTWYKCF